METRTKIPRPDSGLAYRVYLCQQITQARERLGWTTDQAALAFGTTTTIYEQLESGSAWASDETLATTSESLRACRIPQLMIHRAEGR